MRTVCYVTLKISTHIGYAKNNPTVVGYTLTTNFLYVVKYPNCLTCNSPKFRKFLLGSSSTSLRFTHILICVFLILFIHLRKHLYLG